MKRFSTGHWTVLSILAVGLFAAGGALFYWSHYVSVGEHSATGRIPEGRGVSAAPGEPARRNRLEQRLAALQSEGGRATPLIEAIQAYAAEHPRDPGGHLLLAQSLMAAGRAPEAYAPITRSLELDPEQPEAALIAGTIALKLGRADAAATHYAHALGRTDSNRARLHLARARIQQGRLEAAERLLRSVIRRDSGSHVAYAALADVHARRGEPLQGVEALAEALARLTVQDEDRRIPYTRRQAALLREADRPGEALQVLMRLTPGQQAEIEVLEEMAACYAMLGKPARAAAHFENALRALPMNRKLLARAARYRIEAGDLEAARRHHGRLWRLAPEAPETQRIGEAIEAAAR